MVKTCDIIYVAILFQGQSESSEKDEDVFPFHSGLRATLVEPS